MNTASIKAAMRARYCAPEWALMYEVGNATGSQQRRWADAVAMNLYPSRGLEIHGFEFKASRSDWTRELKNPDKSGPVQQYCDRWWVVTLPDIVREGELPPTWGLLVLQPSGQLRQVVAAPKLEAEPPGRPFIAAMLRRASEVDASEVQAAVEVQMKDLRERNERDIEQRVRYKTRKADEALEAIATFEAASGISLRNFNAAAIGAAARYVHSAGVMSSYGGLRSIAEQARQIAEKCEAVLDPFAAHIEAAKQGMAANPETKSNADFL